MDGNGGPRVSAGARTRVLVVEGEASQRATIVDALRSCGYGVHLVTTLADARANLALAPRFYAAAVTNLELPDGSASDLLPVLLSGDVSCCPLVIGRRLDGQTAIALRRLGVNRTLRWPTTRPKFLAGVKATISDTIRYRAAIGWPLPPEPSSSATNLRLVLAELGATEREAVVASMIATGATDRVIAATLHIALSTVRQRTERLKRRFGARSKDALGALLRELGGQAAE